MYDHAQWKRRATHTLGCRTLMSVTADTDMADMAKQTRRCATCHAKETIRKIVAAILQTWSISLA